MCSSDLKEENLAEEDSCPEEDGKEEMFDVIQVESGDICHGTILIINQQVRGMQMWLREIQNHYNIWRKKNPLKKVNHCY